MKKYMPLEGLRWSRDSGSTLCDTPQNGRSRTGWGGRREFIVDSLQLISREFDDKLQISFDFLGGFEEKAYFCGRYYEL